MLTNRIGAGWVVLDILGGVVPVIIDAATGAWYAFDQNHVSAVFEENQDNLFDASLFETESRLPHFRAAVPRAEKYTDDQIVEMFKSKFPKLRSKSDGEIIRMIERRCGGKE